MKKLIFLIAVLTATVSFGQQNKIWAFSCSDKSIAQNHSEQDAWSYLQTGSLSSAVLQDRYTDKSGKPMPVDLALRAASTGMQNARKAFCARLNQINLANGNYLYNGTITWEVVEVLKTKGVFFTQELPMMLLVQNGNLVAPNGQSLGVEPVNRYPHKLKDGIEKAIWIRTPSGAEPVMSLFCFNIIGTLVSGSGASSNGNVVTNTTTTTVQDVTQYEGKTSNAEMQPCQPCQNNSVRHTETQVGQCAGCTRRSNPCNDCDDNDDVYITFSDNIPSSRASVAMPNMTLPSAVVYTSNSTAIMMPMPTGGIFSGGSGSANNTGFGSGSVNTTTSGSINRGF